MGFHWVLAGISWGKISDDPPIQATWTPKVWSPMTPQSPWAPWELVPEMEDRFRCPLVNVYITMVKITMLYIAG